MSKVYHAHQLPLFPSKVCTACGIEKPLEEFYKNRTKKDGYLTFCKDCYRERHRDRMQQNQRNYRLRHLERARQSGREHHYRHLEQRQKQSREYRDAHREQIREYSREYRDAHREQIRQRQREYYATNHERRRQESREYYAIHREQENQRNRAWSKANPLNEAERTRRYNARKKSASVDLIDYKAILERDGLWCYICEKDILPHHKLHFDHVIPLTRGGAHSEENIKPTHAECNLRKHNKLLSEMTTHQRRGVT